jgi:hypothetical protein
MPNVTFASNHVDPDSPTGPPEFQCLGEGHYQFATGSLDILIEVDRLRLERRELVGQLTVYCQLAGVSMIEGKLSDATFNLSRLRDRRELAQWLAQRAKTGELVDWTGLLEEFCQRVLQAEREGNAAIDLRTLPPTQPEPFHEVLGLRLPARNLAIPFGAGGCGKTWLADIVAAELTRRGERVGLWDWEMDEYAHRERLQRLYGADIPGLIYIRCDRPLVLELDRHKRLVEKHRLTYGCFDSAGYACSGPPEAAEAAIEYNQAVRRLGIGSLHIAHNKAEGENDQRPFGSVFWHNSARATWFVKRAQAGDDSGVLTMALYNRKTNLGPLQGAVGLELRFTEDRTTFRPIAVADVGELAEGLPLWQRVKSIVKTRPETYAALADELGAPVDSIVKAVKRKNLVFTLVSGSKDGITRVALVERGKP